MDPRLLGLQLRIDHRHDDGSWSRLERRPSHHTAVEHDPERSWAGGVIYQCTTCEEQIRVHPDPSTEQHG